MKVSRILIGFLKITSLAILIYSLVSDSHALSYNGVGSFSQLDISYSGNLNGGTYSLATSPGKCYSFFNANRCQTYFQQGGYQNWDYFNDGILVDDYANIGFGGIEADFATMTSTGGPYLIFNGTLDGNNNFDLYLSGSQIVFRYYFIGTSDITLLYRSTINISSIPSDYSTINWGGFHPKKAFFGIATNIYSANTPLGGEGFLQGIRIQRITNDSKTLTIDFTESGSTLGYKFSNTFADYELNMGDAYTYCNPYCSAPPGYSIDSSFFPYYSGGTNEYNGVHGINFSFHSIQSYFDTLNGGVYEGTDINPFFDNISKFYTGTGSLGVTIGNGDNTDTPGGGSSGNDYFSNCENFLDVGCYVEAVWYTVKDWIYSFFPSISWTGQSYGCTSSGSSSPIGYSGSSAFIQNIVNMMVIVSPFPPPDGSEMCLVGREIWDPIMGSSGGVVTIEYQKLVNEDSKLDNGLTFFDIFIMLIIGIAFLNTFRKGHGGVHSSSNTPTTGSK